MSMKESRCDCNCIHEKETKSAMKVLLEIRDIDVLCEFYKNFSDITRLKIIAVLDKVKKMCVGDIAVTLNMTKSAISHQLKYLKDNNLVVSEKIGKIVFYSLADKHVRDIFEIGLKHIRENV